MVDPLNTQNMVSRMPAVEKTVASHRENAPQVQAQVEQAQRDKQRVDEHVQQDREPLRAEAGNKDGGEGHANAKKKKPQAPAAEDAPVELVQEEADNPEHKLDVTI